MEKIKVALTEKDYWLIREVFAEYPLYCLEKERKALLRKLEYAYKRDINCNINYWRNT